jgi:hypothetical protein
MARYKRLFGLAALIVLLLATFTTGWIVAKTGLGSAMDPTTLPDRERQFAERMKDAVLVGSFTRTDREGPARPDRYDLSSVDKIGEDRWRFNATIGETGRTAPIPVTMLWVGDTPMIMLTGLAIPGMGTFTARVFFYENLYAGTWQHGSVSGHIFGRIEKQKK